VAYETIRLAVDARGVATVTIDRPEVRNAVNRRMVDEMHDVFGALEAREDLRALVLTSTGGRAFVSGADIAELRERRREDALQGINAALFARLEAFPRPTVAAIVGHCLGGGLELALACDFRVAGASSRLGQPEVSLGIMAAAGGTRRLPALIGLAAARRLLFGAEIVDAAEALRLGLVDRVVADEEVAGAVDALLAPLLAQAPEALRRTKQALLAWLHGAGETALRELDNRLQADLFEHPDKQARMDAFLARRRQAQSPT
jgi:enoyl-CoA hydratase